MSSVLNLTEVAAQQRTGLLNVAGYDVAMDLTDGAGGASESTFRTTSTIRFECTAPGSGTFIECAAVRVIKATLNGVPVDTQGWSAETGLPLAGLAVSNVLVITAEFAFSGSQRGMYRSVDPADGEAYLYTSFEPASAQLVFACFDQPDLKAEFTWHVTAPRAWRVISNMGVCGQDEHDNGSDTVHFATSPRMSTYLTVVCAGPFAEVRSTEGGRDLGIYCRTSMLEHLEVDEILDLTRRGMDYYEAQFGQLYPLPKYDHVAVPEFSGAMENFGCIVVGESHLIFRSKPTESDRVLRSMIILHELAHMWFGDLVTMRWWDDLWLNEAFATWASFWCMAEATTLTEPWAAFAVELKSRGIKADQASTTHPVYSRAPDVQTIELNFDAITYLKGASVLKQLAAYVGIDPFTAGLRAYFARNAWGNATFADLVGALEAASGRPVREFATLWLETAQVNTLRPEITVDADGRYGSIAVLQEAPAGYPTLRAHRLGIGLYDLGESGLVRRELLDVEVSGPRTVIAELAGQPSADVLLLNDEDLTFAKVRLDERSLDTVMRHVAAFPAALPRAVCWAATIDMLNDAEMAAREFIELVCNGLPAESDTGLVSSVLAEASMAIGYFADPAWAPTGWAKLAAMSRQAAYDAEPGSSLQLTWARTFASAARTRDGLDLLRAWLDGKEVPAGLVIDAELRWLILQGLVASGAADGDEIEREFAADTSVGGLRSAAKARALIPTAEAKERAWRLALEPGATDVRIATLGSFGHPAHVAITAPYVDRYFATLDEIWREQGSEVGRFFAVLCFPKAHISAETLAAADAWCASDGHPSPLVRLVTEGRDTMARAVAARARDAATS